jgi:hypothetical protein
MAVRLRTKAFRGNAGQLTRTAGARRPPGSQPGPATTVSGQRGPPAAYLKHGGTIEKAAAMANHASTRTTQLCDRWRDEPSLDEVERIVI